MTKKLGWGAVLVFAAWIAATLSIAGAQNVAPYSSDNPVVTDPLTQKFLDLLTSADLGGKSKLGAYVVDTRYGMVHVDINSSVRLKPASLMKLVTTAAALTTLGPDKVFQTILEADGSISDGVLRGDLVIVGGGDPSLGPRFQKDRNDVTAFIDEMAKATEKAGIRRIVGNVVGDDLRYPYDPTGLGWEKMELGEWYSAEVGPLNFNENVVDVIWEAGKVPDEKVKFELIPKTKYVNFTSGVRVGPERMKESSVRYFRFADTNEIRARGRIPPNHVKYDFAAIHDPARFISYLLVDDLEGRGIKVGGGPVSLHTLSDSERLSTNTLQLLVHNSPPLSQLLPVVNGQSQNLYAEVLLRELALAQGEKADFRGGAKAATDWLVGNSVHRTGFLMVDGSGLSPVNTAPARLFTDLLTFMLKSPFADVYTSSLATPGHGSLENRFVALEDTPLEGKLHAKTGYLAGCHSLAGYVRNKRGTEYAFTLILNDYDPRKSQDALNLIDRLVLEIYQSDVLP